MAPSPPPCSEIPDPGARRTELPTSICINIYIYTRVTFVAIRRHVKSIRVSGIELCGSEKSFCISSCSEDSSFECQWLR